MFDPEKVDRFDTRDDECVHSGGNPYVLASDYDQLLALYKKQEGALEWMRRSLMQKLTFRRALALVPCLLKWK